MQNRNDILYHFFLQRCRFIVYNKDCCPKPLKCAFKPVEAETNKTVFVGDMNSADLTIKALVDQAVPFLSVIVQAAPDIFNVLIGDHASHIGELAEELDLIYQIVFLVS